MDDYQKLTLRITGVAPLIMHNGRLSDPLDHWSKELKKFTSKRKKTESDFVEIARIEWYGGLYWREDSGPGLPGDAVERMILDGAKKIRRGPEIKSGVIVDGFYPLEYEGPRGMQELWDSGEHRLTVQAKNPGQSGRVPRTRPIFRKWAAIISPEFLPDIVDRAILLECIEIAGRVIGIGDWRPRYGRFTVEQVAELAKAA